MIRSIIYTITIILSASISFAEILQSFAYGDAISDIDDRDILLGQLAPDDVEDIADYERPSKAQIRSIALNILMLHRKENRYIDKFLRFYCNKDMSFQHRYIVYHPYTKGLVVSDFNATGGQKALFDSIALVKELTNNDVMSLKVDNVDLSEDKRVGSAALKMLRKYPIDIAQNKEGFINLSTKMRASFDEATIKKLLKLSRFNVIMNTSCNFSFGLSATYVVEGMNCLSTVYFT